MEEEDKDLFFHEDGRLKTQQEQDSSLEDKLYQIEHEKDIIEQRHLELETEFDEAIQDNEAKTRRILELEKQLRNTERLALMRKDELEEMTPVYMELQQLKVEKGTLQDVLKQSKKQQEELEKELLEREEETHRLAEKMSQQAQDRMTDAGIISNKNKSMRRRSRFGEGAVDISQLAEHREAMLEKQALEIQQLKDLLDESMARNEALSQQRTKKSGDDSDSDNDSEQGFSLEDELNATLEQEEKMKSEQARLEEEAKMRKEAEEKLQQIHLERERERQEREALQSRLAEIEQASEREREEKEKLRQEIEMAKREAEDRARELQKQQELFQKQQEEHAKRLEEEQNQLNKAIEREKQQQQQQQEEKQERSAFEMKNDSKIGTNASVGLEESSTPKENNHSGSSNLTVDSSSVVVHAPIMPLDEHQYQNVIGSDKTNSVVYVEDHRNNNEKRTVQENQTLPQNAMPPAVSSQQQQPTSTSNRINIISKLHQHFPSLNKDTIASAFDRTKGNVRVATMVLKKFVESKRSSKNKSNSNSSSSSSSFKQNANQSLKDRQQQLLKDREVQRRDELQKEKDQLHQQLQLQEQDVNYQEQESMYHDDSRNSTSREAVSMSSPQMVASTVHETMEYSEEYEETEAEEAPQKQPIQSSMSPPSQVQQQRPHGVAREMGTLPPPYLDERGNPPDYSARLLETQLQEFSLRLDGPAASSYSEALSFHKELSKYHGSVVVLPSQEHIFPIELVENFCAVYLGLGKKLTTRCNFKVTPIAVSIMSENRFSMIVEWPLGLICQLKATSESFVVEGWIRHLNKPGAMEMRFIDAAAENIFALVREYIHKFQHDRDKIIARRLQESEFRQRSDTLGNGEFLDELRMDEEFNRILESETRSGFTDVNGVDNNTYRAMIKAAGENTRKQLKKRSSKFKRIFSRKKGVANAADLHERG